MSPLRSRARANPGECGVVLVAAGDVPGHAHDVLGACAGTGKHGDDIGERLPHLRREVVADEVLLGIPADLARDIHLAALGSDAVRVAARPRPTRRLQDLAAHRRTSRPITSFCTSLAPS